MQRNGHLVAFKQGFVVFHSFCLKNFFPQCTLRGCSRGHLDLNVKFLPNGALLFFVRCGGCHCSSSSSSSAPSSFPSVESSAVQPLEEWQGGDSLLDQMHFGALEGDAKLSPGQRAAHKRVRSQYLLSRTDQAKLKQVSPLLLFSLSLFSFSLCLRAFVF